MVDKKKMSQLIVTFIFILKNPISTNVVIALFYIKKNCGIPKSITPQCEEKMKDSSANYILIGGSVLSRVRISARNKVAEHR